MCSVRTQISIRGRSLPRPVDVFSPSNPTGSTSGVRMFRPRPFMIVEREPSPSPLVLRVCSHAETAVANTTLSTMPISIGSPETLVLAVITKSTGLIRE